MSVQQENPAFATIDKLNVIYEAGLDGQGRPVIVLCACQLPNPDVMDYDTVLADTLTESEYVLAFFASPAYYRPSWMWLLKVYRALDRKYKKNLKALYVVHLEGAFRYIFDFANRLMSPKFAEKLFYISHLENLDPILPLRNLNLPQPVIDYELQLPSVNASSSTATVDKRRGTTGFGSTGKYGTRRNTTEVAMAFGRTLDDLAEIDRITGVNIGEDYIPPVLCLMIEHLRQHGMDQEGIFRKSPSSVEFKQVKHALNKRIPVDLKNYDIHISSNLVKTFVKELPVPLLTSRDVHCLDKATVRQERVGQMQGVISRLPRYERNVLQYVLCFLGEVADHSDVNSMTINNLAILFAPNLIHHQPASATDQFTTQEEALKRANIYLTELQNSIDCLQWMILEHRALFSTDKSLNK
ncbi:Rho GTPase activation protein [Phycomyces blakesleeanus]|uniref:Rho GTPase activation protein n=1 Tax=Phycomyces blakesleeanus TaxID=4837 RepID=A0ABR3ATH8_PHYBL